MAVVDVRVSVGVVRAVLEAVLEAGGGGGVTGYLLMRGFQMSLMYSPESWGTVLWR